MQRRLISNPTDNYFQLQSIKLTETYQAATTSEF